jgi:hypothetical protein
MASPGHQPLPQVTGLADAPQGNFVSEKLDEHAFIDLSEDLLNHASTKISTEHLQRSPIVKHFFLVLIQLRSPKTGTV